MIVFITKDLFFVPVLQSAGVKQGVEVTALMSLNSPKASAIEAQQVTAAIIDLASTDIPELGPLVSELRAMYPSAQIAAFGPHVQEGRLTAAREAGCDQVLTRGQLNSQIDSLVKGWAGN